MMHIPEKYRERYDVLAEEHPRMQEMKDEPTNVIGGETNGIADGSPLVDELPEGDACGDDRFELIGKAKTKLLESTNIESRPDEMAVLDSILFRCWQMGWLDQLREKPEPPEGDAIEHARWRWKYRPGEKSEVVMSEYNCNLLMSDLDAIADMVERDYVKRGDYEDLALLKAQAERERAEAIRAMKAAQDAMEQARDERDDMKSELDKYEHDCGLLFTERDDYKDIVDVLKHERDNLKAKIAEYEHNGKQITAISGGRIYTGSKALVEQIAEQDRRIAELTEEIAKRDKGIERLKRQRDEAREELRKFEDVSSEVKSVAAERDEWKIKCETREVAYKQADAERKRYSEQIDELRAERDEWKAKAENLGSNLGSGSEVGSEVDSREKLEDDVGFIVKEGFVTYKGIIGWLDRQAAITKSQMHERYYHAACVKDERTRTLRAEYEDCISELERERDYWREQMRKCLDATRCGEDAAESLMAYPLPAGRVQPYLMVVDAIDSERDFMADIKRLERERDGWVVETGKLWTAVCRLESRLDAIEDGMDGGLA